MEDRILEVLNSDNTRLSFKGIKKAISLSRFDEEKLVNLLNKMELEGLIYLDKDGLYQKFPSNFFIATVEFSIKGNPFIVYDDNKFNITIEKCNGALNYDTVVVDDNNNVIKVLKRANNHVVCEVKENKYNQKYVVVRNQKNEVKVSIGQNALKKLVDGSLILVEISTEMYDDTYIADVIKVIGHKNDLDAELKTIAFNNGFLTEYSDQILKEIDEIPEEINENDLENRVDKRNANIFTIDGIYTKDIDDAVEIKRLKNGNYLLTVHIAHVSNYVKPHTAIWEFASTNTTSLYLVNSVMAMLHSKLSNGICSLNEGVDRLARSFEMEIDQYGDVVDFNIYKSVINSKKKMTYDDVNLILEKNIIPSGYQDYVEDLRLLHKLSNIISLKRTANGAIDIDNKEITFKIDDEGNIERGENKRGAAEKLIENAMVITNESVGEYFYYLLVPFVYRNHEFPFEQKKHELYNTLKQLGYKFETINNVSDPRILQKIINSLSKKEEFVVLMVLILRSMPKAYYSKVNRGHFGLAIDSYSQSTSPIRRFLDLVIHTLIDKYEDLTIELDYDYLEKCIEDYCTRATIKERWADKAEYEADQLYMVKYMQDKVGEEFFGYISDINSKFISIKTTDLIDGYCFFDLTGSDYQYLPDSKSIYNKKQKKQLQIGSKVHLKLVEADLATRQIRFDILEKDRDDVLIRQRAK